MGALLVTGGSAGLTWGLTLASGPGGWAGPALWGLGTGGALIALFVVFEKQRGADAMLPLHPFASRAFVGLSLVTCLLYGASRPASAAGRPRCPRCSSTRWAWPARWRR